MEWTQGQQRSNMNINNSQLTPLLKMIEDLIKAMQYASGKISCPSTETQYICFLLEVFCSPELCCLCYRYCTVSALWFPISRQCVDKKQHVSRSALWKAFVFLTIKKFLDNSYQTNWNHNMMGKCKKEMWYGEDNKTRYISNIKIHHEQFCYEYLQSRNQNSLYLKRKCFQDWTGDLLATESQASMAKNK